MMSTTSVGRNAERMVAEHLKEQGYALLDQNWRTRQCEIDLVMKRKGTVYFIEVKYRGSGVYGAGLEYITPKKLQQMRFAAEMWIAKTEWEGDVELMGAEVNVVGTIEVINLH